jgi:hypothetical protein
MHYLYPTQESFEINLFNPPDVFFASNPPDVVFYQGKGIACMWFVGGFQGAPTWYIDSDVCISISGWTHLISIRSALRKELDKETILILSLYMYKT